MPAQGVPIVGGPMASESDDAALPADPGEARALVEAVTELHRAGWCPATSSNFSYRPLRAGTRPGFWISQSGVDKGRFGPEHLMAVDASGVPIPPERRRPSAETGLHALVYRVHPEAGAVLHVHAPHSVVASRAHLAQGEVRFSGWELQKGLAGQTTHEAEVRVPIFDNAQDIPALAEAIEPVLRDRPHLTAFLLAGHGLYAFGRSVAEAKRHVEVVETLLHHEHLWRALR